MLGYINFRKIGDMMKVAIFDFDGTIYKKETFTLLMDHLKNHPTYGSRYKRFYRSVLAPYIGYKIRIYPERKMKLQMMHRYLRTFQGLTEIEFAHYFAEIASKMKPDLNTEVISRLEEHTKNDVYIMIVSGAFTPLLQDVFKPFPVDQIIGTNVPFHNGEFDMSQQIDHVHAERKTELIKKNLKGKEIDWENSYAYGDSYSDLSVLNLVGNPVVVCPEDSFRMVAYENK